MAWPGRGKPHRFGEYPKTNDWGQLLPPDVVSMQKTWEIDRMLLRFRRMTGWTYKQIGEEFKISSETIRMRCNRAERNEGRSSPVERHLSRLPYGLEPMVFEITCNGEKHDQP